MASFRFAGSGTCTSGADVAGVNIPPSSHHNNRPEVE
jgi:hypothetical protein